MKRCLSLLSVFMFLSARLAFGAFVVNGNGTVTDTSTGLMWQQETVGTMNWETAISYCESLHLGGYNDWRLPNINELQSLVDYNIGCRPTIDTTIFPNTESSYYWSSTSYDYAGYYTDCAWTVDFSNGVVYSYIKSYSTYRYVRAVRSVPLGDLVILKDSLKLSCYGGDIGTQIVSAEEVTISVEVKSASSQQVSNVEVAFYEEDTAQPGEWNLIGSPKVIDSIDPNSSKSTYGIWQPTQARHRIKVVVDPDKKIEETDETNNEAIIEFKEEAVPLHTAYQIIDEQGNIRGTQEKLTSNILQVYLGAFNATSGKWKKTYISTGDYLPAPFTTPEEAKISYNITLYYQDSTPSKELPTRFLKTYRIPVIFIPGIFGTNLFGNSLWRKIIPNSIDPVDYLMPTANKGMGAVIVDLTGGDPKKIQGALMVKRLKMELLDIPKFSYKGLIEKITEAGYIKDETFFEFPYNWILPIRTNGNLLRNKILEIKDKTPVGKVDLVCHSTGGLISRSYIQLNNFYKKEVNKLISIEVPHCGSPKPYPMLQGNLPFPEFAYNLLYDEWILPMANKKNNEPSFEPSDIYSVHRVMNSEKLHKYINEDFVGLKDLLSDGSTDYLVDIESGNVVAGPVNSFLQILNQNVDLKGKGVHHKNIVCIENDTPSELDVRLKSSSYWYPFPFPATMWINHLHWNPPSPLNQLYDWKSWMTAPNCITNCYTRWTSWLDWQWQNGVFLKVNKPYGGGDGTVPAESLIPQFCKGKNFGQPITEIVPSTQDGKHYAHDDLPCSPKVIEITLDYLLGQGYQGPSRAKLSDIETTSTVSLEKEMIISWFSTADLTILDPSGRFAKVRPSLDDLDGDIPHFYCYSLKNQSTLFGIKPVLDGSYEFQVSGPSGTPYELKVTQSINSFEVDEQSFSGAILEEGQIITHQLIPPANQPIALFTADPNPALSGQQIFFDASQSYHLSSEHSITYYEWDWTSDGTYDDSGMNVTYTYPEEGEYIVTLRVTDDNTPPKSMTTQMAVTVSKNFEADFSALSSTGCSPFTVHFQDLSTGAETWSWDFNHDGIEDSQEQNPAYCYEFPGTYTVSLTITGNSRTDTKVMNDYIVVRDCPSIIYVDQNAQSNGDGSSWEKALTTIQGAIIVAQSGNHIWVTRGIYRESFKINGISLYGGFSGDETNVSQRDTLHDHTIIDGENLRTGIVVNNGTLDGFKIVNHQGSGVRASLSTIVNNMIMNNHSTDNGGGIFVGGNSTIENNVIADNSANLKGGGIYVDIDTPATIVNNTICGNSGGGIFFSPGSSVTVINNIICNNLEAEGLKGEGDFSFEISYNNLWNNSPGDYSGNLSGENNISSDPLFIDADKGNFFLEPNSSCSNLGHPSSYYHDPDDTRNDMGAYGGPSLSYQYFSDLDSDGYASVYGDCDDNDLSTYPGASELCDRLDNDCDGQVDEDLMRDCSNACGQGMETCQDGEWIGCTAPPQPHNCGQCGALCPSYPHAESLCMNSQCVMGTCEEGWQDLDGDPDNGCEYGEGNEDFSITLDMPSGWSIISLPVDPIDQRIKTLFPEARAVFEFTNKYMFLDPNAELEIGKGYWICLPAARSYSVTGIPIESYSIPNASSGWSMIGACTDPSTPSVDQGTIRAIFGFSNEHGFIEQVDPLQPGKGYWINLSEEATLTVE